MAYTFTAMTDEHRQAVTSILNHHIENGFAAYPSQAHGPEMFDFLRRLAAGYPAYVVEDGQGRVIGHGMLRRHLMADTLARTAEVSYFFMPGHTGKGLGSQMLERLTSEGRAMGIDNLLANVSSRNPGSLRFHQRHGFKEVGRFRRAGRKWDQDFDIVWLQKFI